MTKEQLEALLQQYPIEHFRRQLDRLWFNSNDKRKKEKK